MTSPALWLARRELAARARRVVLAGAVVAAVAASVTATELVTQARARDVAVQIDAMGPALTLAPEGTTASTLARCELEGAIPSHTEADVRRALGPRLRAVERRVVIHRDIMGTRRAVIGVDPDETSDAALDARAASVGSELGRLIGVGARFSIGSRELTVGRVRPSTGSAEDFAVFMPAATLRSLEGVEGVTELRVFLAPGVAPRDAEALLAATVRGATVVRTDRGEIADGAVQDSLARHRAAAYAILAAVAALTLVIASHLDATERRVELATLVAIGASRWTVLGELVARSGTVAFGGAAAGTMIGALLAPALDGSAPRVLSGVVGLAATIVVAGMLLGLVAASPTAILSAARDPVRELQES